MASTMRQLQGLRHTLCSSDSFHNKKRLNKCSTSANVRVPYGDYMPKQGLNFSPELVSRRIRYPFIISAYRCSGQKLQFIGHLSQPPKHNVELSYMPKVFEVGSLAANGSLPFVSEESKITCRSEVMQKKLTESPEMVEGTPSESERPKSTETPGSKVEIHKRERYRVWEVVSSYFLALDATVKITMLLFIACYVAIGVIYGVEVLKELTPLWILGPLIVAVDIKMFRAILQLYVFSFKQAEKAIRSIPSPKKLTEAIYTYIFQILVKVKSLDYKKAAKLKLKETMLWSENISAFFFTWSWPLYWRIIRFLTRSNLIAPKF